MTKGNAPVTIAVVDDHPLYRNGLVHFLENEKDFKVTIEADSVHSTLEALEKTSVSILLLDLSLRDSNGLDLLKDIGIRHPSIPILVVSMHDEEYYAERVRAIGGKGYVMKQEDPGIIILAIKKILSGKVFFRTTRSSNIQDPLTALTTREFEVFELLGKGFGSKQLSAKLNLSVKTIDAHKEHIKEKLNLRDSSELLQFAITWKKNVI